MSYIAYKGFNKNLATSWKDTNFEIGVTYSKPNVEKPVLCTDQGFHYCDKLTETYSYYSEGMGSRYCEIEVLGNFTKGGPIQGYKNITTSFRIIRELGKEERDQITAKENIEKAKELKQEALKRMPHNLNLWAVKELQTKYPMSHVGGSAAMFLHGTRLERWGKTESSDLDIIFPYYVLIEGQTSTKDDENEIEVRKATKSGNDFDECFLYTSGKETVKIDIRVDPKQQYEIIEYEGFKYKVSKLETILAAKLKYAMNGQTKHMNDIYEICEKKVSRNLEISW